MLTERIEAHQAKAQQAAALVHAQDGIWGSNELGPNKRWLSHPDADLCDLLRPPSREGDGQGGLEPNAEVGEAARRVPPTRGHGVDDGAGLGELGQEADHGVGENPGKEYWPSSGLEFQSGDRSAIRGAPN